MCCQTVHWTEPFPADVAELWLLTTVGSSHVDQQATTATEIASTCFAEVRLLTCVGPHVDFQDTVESEIFPTGFARIRLLSCVDSHMSVQF